MQTPIKIKYLDENCKLIRATEGALCFDVKARVSEPITIKAGEIKLIPLGFSIDTGDKTIGALIFMRSGLSSKHGLMAINSVGIIDSDYRGEVHIALYNTGVYGDYIICPYERVGQVCFLKVEDVDLIEVDELEESKRGTGGFGHTGKI